MKIESLRPWTIARALAVAAALAVLAQVVTHVDRARAAALLSDVGLKLLFVPLPFLIAMSLDAVGWRSILATMGKPVGFLALLRVRLATEALLLTIPGGGIAMEIAKPVALHHTSGVPTPVGAASVAVKKALVILADALYLIVGLVGGGAFAVGALAAVLGPRTWLVPVGGAALVIVFCALGGLMVALLAKGHVAAHVLALLERIPGERLRAGLKSRASAFAAVDGASAAFFARGARVSAWPFLLFFVQWMIDAVETWIFLAMLGVHAPFMAVVIFESLVAFVRNALFFIPNGLGVQDLAQVVFVQTIGGAHASGAAAALLFVKRAKEAFWAVTGYSLLFGMKSERSKHSTSA